MRHEDTSSAPAELAAGRASEPLRRWPFAGEAGLAATGLRALFGRARILLRQALLTRRRYEKLL